MTGKAMSLDNFLGVFASLCRDRDTEAETRPFSLIIGAGGSRSAGIPLASEMIRALEELARVSGIRLADSGTAETKWSWVFRQVLGALSPDHSFPEYARDFVVECVSRARGEANATHLLAAALTNGGVFRYIVTTNFDDQALAGFWSLPRGHKGTKYIEPHVIYDAASTSRSVSNIAAKVPVILKAHGHHTTYGLGIVDADIHALAPHVMRAIHQLPAPIHGFLVVGYSENWNDGIMRALTDNVFIKGKTVYWFHIGPKRPASPGIETLSRVADLRFVQIADSDDLFLRLWWESEARWYDESDDRQAMLDPTDLFTFSATFRRWAPMHLVAKNCWWYPPREWSSRKFHEVKRRLLPALLRAEKDDEDLLIYQCLPDSLKSRIAGGQFHVSDPQLPHAEWQNLFEIMPLGVPWTRRNRKLAIRALSKNCHPGVRAEIMEGLGGWGYDPRLTLDFTPT